MLQLIGIRLENIKRKYNSIFVFLFIPFLICIGLIVAFIYGLVLLFTPSDKPWFDDYYSSQKSNILLKNNFNNSQLLKYKIPENKVVNYTIEKKINIKYFFENNEINKNHFENKEINQKEKPNLKTNYSNLSNDNNFFNKKIFSHKKVKERDVSDNIFKDYICTPIIAVECNINIFLLLNIIMEEKSKKLDIYLQLKNISNTKYFFSWFLVYLACALIKFISMFLFVLSLAGYEGIIFLLFYIINLYIFSYFFFKLFTNPKIAYIFMFFLNIISLVGGFFLSFAKIRILKLFSAIFPNVNIFLVISVCYHYYVSLFEGKNIRYRGISYNESLLLFLIQFILFTSLIICFEYFKKCRSR